MDQNILTVISELQQRDHRDTYKELKQLWRKYNSKCESARRKYGNADGVGEDEQEASQNILSNFMIYNSSLSDAYSDDELGYEFIDELDRAVCDIFSEQLDIQRKKLKQINQKSYTLTDIENLCEGKHDWDYCYKKKVPLLHFLKKGTALSVEDGRGECVDLLHHDMKPFADNEMSLSEAKKQYPESTIWENSALTKYTLEVKNLPEDEDFETVEEYEKAYKEFFDNHKFTEEEIREMIVETKVEEYYLITETPLW